MSRRIGFWPDMAWGGTGDEPRRQDERPRSKPMRTRTRNRTPARQARFSLRSVQCILLAGLATLAAAGTGLADELKKSGSVRIEQVQVAFIGSGNLGGGTLLFGGKSYPFTIGGLGIGGIGLSKITATGEVYNLDRIEYFPGGYVQARAGYALGTASAGKLWLENSHGVVLELAAEREGLALSLGGDVIYIGLD
jgi:hypothetical protein